MKQLWTNKQQNPACILFFNGWGMDENTISHLDNHGFDICMFYDYKTIEPVAIDRTTYQEAYLVAWSLGVWAAGHALHLANANITKTIALNGTFNPIHDELGIPIKIFTSTLEGWDEKNREKFNIRMMGGKKNNDAYGHLLSKRDTKDQQEELNAIFQHCQTNSLADFNWDVALIGDQDLIFPSLNQLRCWNGKTSIVKTSLPHFPFLGIKSWKDVIHQKN